MTTATPYRSTARRLHAAGAASALLGLALLAGCGPRSPVAEVLPGSPGMNVLVVSFDALRADRLGTYGYSRPTSPRIDAFANDAAVFENAWSAAQATPSSFAAAFTGLWPTKVFRAWELQPEPATVGEAFAAAGYQTTFLSGQVQLVPARGFQRGFDTYEILPRSPENDADRDGVLDDEVLLERFEAWLSGEAPRDRPFFAWVHFIAPHTPYRVREGAEHLYRDGFRGRFETTTGHTFEVHSEAELERVQDLYDGQVLFADQLFGQVLDALEAAGMSDNTVVVLTTDHGEELMDHGGLQHATVYEEVIRIPLIVRHPQAVSGLRSYLPASNVDLFPTLASMAGVEVPEGLDGISLRQAVLPERVRLSLAMTHSTDNYAAISKGSKKAILDCHHGTGSLYDLEADPGETVDRISEERRVYRDLVANATEALGAEPCQAIGEALRGVSPDTGLDKETREGLMALGYLGGESAQEPADGRVFWADPSPIQVCDGLPLGETRLFWRVPGPHVRLEIRVQAADGKLMAEVPSSGSIPTERWVKDGMEFFLIEPTTGKVISSLTAEVTDEGC